MKIPIYLTDIDTKSYKNIIVIVIYKFKESQKAGNLNLKTDSRSITINVPSKAKEAGNGYYEVTRTIIDSKAIIKGIEISAPRYPAIRLILDF